MDGTRLWVDSRARYEIGLREEGATLARLGAHGQRCLDVGTGRRGLGARVAVTALGATEVLALDLHQASVEAARRALADLGDRVVVQRADATALPVGAGTQDLVVSLHTLHHVVDWRAAVVEYARVLRPGGQLAYAELTSRVLDDRWFRLVSRHPADRFTEDELLECLEGAGFDVPARRHRSRVGGRWLLGVATRR
ncbi:Methyltransferase domain-containing protein [Klenkia marina]|uniref:Methyltransferase domain-containing protein n=1 Tax=Klenkia marina TaxID=1960309 RepID=A0A1G4YIE2_9ACTN|nr:Methyltransferase domain-containing protein [Klenkia marina]